MTGMGVKNGRTIRFLARREYRGNMKKNLMTVLAICMTTFLITVVFSLGISYYKTLTSRSLALAGMKYDVALPEPTDKQLQRAHGIKGVKYSGLAVKCAVIDKHEGNSTHIRLFWADKECWEKQCVPAFQMIKGEYPKDGREIMLSASSLSELGIDNPKVGMDIPVKWSSLSEKSDLKNCRSTFRLSGYYKDFNTHANGYISKSFYDKTGVSQTDITNGNLYLTLEKPLYGSAYIKNLNAQLELHGNQVINRDPYLLVNFVKMMSAVVFLAALIFVSGYLFIYNIFYISIVKGIRYYGQLKTIGITGKQMKIYVAWQIVWNVILGIPAGLLIGGLVAVRVVPIMIDGLSNISEQKQVVAFHPALFGAAAVFALLVVWLGSHQLMKRVAALTPIEAIHFTGISERKQEKRSTKRLTILRMGLQNMSRNKKQLAISSLSLFVVMTMYLIVSVIIQGNGAKTVLDKLYSYDARVLNSGLLDHPEHQGIPKKLENQISEITGVKRTRKVYSQQITYDYNDTFQLLEHYLKRVYSLSVFSQNEFRQDMKKWKEDPESYQSRARIVGVDEKEFDALNKEAKGKLDKKSFLNGNGAIISGFLHTSAKDVIGKKLRFQIYGEKDSCSIQIKWELNDSQDSPNYLAGSTLPDIIVSEKLYKKLVSNPILESLNVDYNNVLDRNTDKSIQALVKKRKDLELSIKTASYAQMHQNEMRLCVLGNSLCAILAVLAFMNFGNMTAIGIQNRKKELATMQSIGMTKRQQIGMLAAEGAGYAGISVVGSLIIGIPLSYILSRIINTYQTVYSFPILKNLVFLLFMFVFCCGIEVVLYQILQKGSIVELMKA